MFGSIWNFFFLQWHLIKQNYATLLQFIIFISLTVSGIINSYFQIFDCIVSPTIMNIVFKQKLKIYNWNMIFYVRCFDSRWLRIKLNISYQAACYGTIISYTTSKPLNLHSYVISDYSTEVYVPGVIQEIQNQFTRFWEVRNERGTIKGAIRNFYCLL